MDEHQQASVLQMLQHMIQIENNQNKIKNNLYNKNPRLKPRVFIYPFTSLSVSSTRTF